MVQSVPALRRLFSAIGLLLIVGACTFDGVVDPTPVDDQASEDAHPVTPSTPEMPAASGGAFAMGRADPEGSGGQITDDDSGRSKGGAGGASNDGTFGDGDLTVLLILDKSGSMASPWDGGSRWDTAVHAFFSGMAGVESELTVGAILFPLPEQCGVDPIESRSQFSFQNGWSFIDAWASRKASLYPSGSTPLGLAFERADAAIAEAHASGLLDERRFRVMVVTDGEPNCSTDESRLLQLTSSWRDMGIEVHVMGLPGSESAAALLSRLAGEGGTEDYIAPSSGSDAEDTFYEAVR